MILAGIDIGTNTLRLLVAETGPDVFREIYSDRRITRLGENLDRTGRLAPAALERSVTVLSDFSKSISRNGAAAVSALGTSALRNAENRDEFISAVHDRAGLDIRVITGHEEARLTMLGVARSVKERRRDDPLASSLVIDIGGGSTEIITNHAAGTTATSLPLGAVYLTERFIRHDPPTAEELRLLLGHIRGELEKSGIEVRAGRTLLVGTAGTITTLSAMDQRLAVYEPDRINGSVLSREAIDAIITNLARTRLNERRSIPGLEPGREDIILAGSLIAKEIMDRFGFVRMLVSDWGLREGILLDLYGRMVKRNAEQHDTTKRSRA